jgi:hypothetical protein
LQSDIYHLSVLLAKPGLWWKLLTASGVMGLIIGTAHWDQTKSSSRAFLSAEKKYGEEKAWAKVHANRSFLFIETLSGCWLAHIPDPQGKQFYFHPDFTDEDCGEALIAALAASRKVEPEDKSFYVPEREFKSRRKRWVKQTMVRFGYRSKYDMFRDMQLCMVKVNNGVIQIAPGRHTELEVWDRKGIKETDDVFIPLSSSPQKVGAALRLALSRCKDPGYMPAYLVSHTTVQ